MNGVKLLEFSPDHYLRKTSIIAFGLFVSASALLWQKSVTALLTAPKWSADLVLWFPFWPFEPYLSLLIIGLGTLLVTKVSTQVKTRIETAQVTE